MGVFCQILVRNPREGIHKAGQTVTGVIKYAIDTPTEYKQIVVSLIGSGKCSWARNKRLHRGTEDFVIMHHEVLNATTTINTGSYEFPFHFVLPENIPSSIKNETCTISYKIEIKFVKTAIFSINKRFKSELTVYGCVPQSMPNGPIIFGLQKSLFKPFSSKVHIISLKAEIDKRVGAPGENVVVNFAVSNDTDTQITSVVTSLICYTKYESNDGSTLESTKIIKETIKISPSVPINTTVKNSAVIPILPHLYTILHSKIMVREYKIRVAVRLPLPYLNEKTEATIVISEQQRDVTAPVEAVHCDPDDGQPLSYSAMCEDNS